MPLLPNYSALIWNRAARERQRASEHPDESYDDRIAVLVAEEQRELASEIPPYIEDIHRRIRGSEPTHERLLNGTVYTRTGRSPAYCLLFLDEDNVHRIVSYART